MYHSALTSAYIISYYLEVIGSSKADVVQLHFFFCKLAKVMPGRTTLKVTKSLLCALSIFYHSPLEGFLISFGGCHPLLQMRTPSNGWANSWQIIEKQHLLGQPSNKQVMRLLWFSDRIRWKHGSGFQIPCETMLQQRPKVTLLVLYFPSSVLLVQTRGVSSHFFIQINDYVAFYVSTSKETKMCSVKEEI